MLEMVILDSFVTAVIPMFARDPETGYVFLFCNGGHFYSFQLRLVVCGFCFFLWGCCFKGKLAVNLTQHGACHRSVHQLSHVCVDDDEII